MREERIGKRKKSLIRILFCKGESVLRRVNSSAKPVLVKLLEGLFSELYIF